MQTTTQGLTSQCSQVLANDDTYVTAVAGAYRVGQNLTYMYIMIESNPTYETRSVKCRLMYIYIYIICHKNRVRNEELENK